jgi:enamine deaminase RidA (YjgF/YER057c/UK114 family)
MRLAQRALDVLALDELPDLPADRAGHREDLGVGPAKARAEELDDADDVVAQAEQCLKNIAAALEQAGASLADVVRVRYILPRREDFASCWPVLKEYLGDIRPAATMIQAGLYDPRMKFEIEVTARKRRS